jgi:hypothetical protein
MYVMKETPRRWTIVTSSLNEIPRGGTTWTEISNAGRFLPKEMNTNRFYWDSHWLEIWSNHFCPSIGPNWRERGYGLRDQHRNRMVLRGGGAPLSTEGFWVDTVFYEDVNGFFLLLEYLLDRSYHISYCRTILCSVHQQGKHFLLTFSFSFCNAPRSPISYSGSCLHLGVPSEL